MNELDDLDDLEPTYEVFKRRAPSFGLILPLIVLIAVVAIVSGLVLGGVVQGSEVRDQPHAVPTTQPTVLIAP